MQGLCQPPRKEVSSQLRFSTDVYSALGSPETEFLALAVRGNPLGAFKYLPPPDVLILLGASPGWGGVAHTPFVAKVEQC